MPTRVVAAEIHKAAGEPMALALIPGDYTITIRDGDALMRCPLSLADDEAVSLSRKGCRRVTAEISADKGATLTVPRRSVMLEGALGILSVADSDYTQRLTDFGYRPSLNSITDAAMLTGSVVLSAGEHLSYAATFGTLDRPGDPRQPPSQSRGPETPIPQAVVLTLHEIQQSH